MVVVEDGTPPADAVGDIASAYGAQYIPLVQNQGVFTARVMGFDSLPQVDYVAFLDQDDWWHKEFLQILTAALDESPTAPFAACNVFLASSEDTTPLFTDRKPRLRLSDIKIANQLASPSQVLIRYQHARRAGLAPSLSHPGSDDWLLWLALLRYGDAVYIDRPLAYWRQHDAAFHHQRLAMRASEDAVVREWFPRLGFSQADILKYEGRIALDALVQRNSVIEWGRGLHFLLRHPWAFWYAVQFRLEHQRQGVV